MSELFVPISVNDEYGKSQLGLFSIACTPLKTDKESQFNGEGYLEMDEKLKKRFPADFFSFDFYECGRNKEDGFLDPRHFSGNTESISLGILCAAYAANEGRKLKAKYDSIIVTGNFDIGKDGKICLKDVILLEEKYKAVQDYAGRNADKNHLFIYISSEEIITEGLQENNVLVIRYDSNFPVECVYAEIFEPTSRQENIFKQNFDEKYRNEYIETRPFIEWKKELINPECGGFIVEGKSNCGKSIAAVTLCRWLIETSTAEEFEWITIRDNKHFWNTIILPIFFKDKTDIIREYFPQEFNRLDNAIFRKKKSCLIIDNIEGDYVDDILDFLKKKYKSYIKDRLLKVIITSWYKSSDEYLISALNLSEKNAEKLEIERHDFERIVYSVLDKTKFNSEFRKNPENLKREFLNLLYEQCTDGNRIFPGYIPLALAPLQDEGLSDLIDRYKESDIKSLSPKKRIIKIDFEVLDLISQLVLLAFFGLNDYTHELDSKKLCKILNEKIFDTTKLGTTLITEKDITYSVRKLVSKDLILEDRKNTYHSKRDVLEYCIFSKSKREEITNKLAAVRDILISVDIKIEYTIQNDIYNEFTELINKYDNKGKINSYLMQCIKYNQPLKYFETLKKKGFEVQTKENEASPLDEFWQYNTNLDVLNFLIEAGYKIRKKFNIQGIADEKKTNFAVSPLFLSCLCLCKNKNNFEIIKYTLDNHLYEDINKLEFMGFSAIHICTAFSNDPKTFQMLLDFGADKSIAWRGSPLLHLAARNKEDCILEYILREHLYSDIDVKSNNGYTVLQYACLNSPNNKSISLLIDHGADKSVITSRGETLLHLAARNKEDCILEYILREHLYDDIESKDCTGWTALHTAYRYAKSIEAIRLLIEYGADKSVLTSDGWALLPLGAINKNSTILEYIFKNHFYTSIDECGENKNTALFQARTLESFKLLLEHGADPEIVTSKGNNILNAAAMFNRKEIVEYILEHLPMIDPSQKNSDGKTAADLTTDEDIKKLLDNTN